MSRDHRDADHFDYVIVGAGAAGCIVANRLASDGRYTVCLLEAGPNDNNIFLRIPAGVYKVSSDPRYAWQFETEPSVGSGGRPIPMPQGKTLGGSTAINGMNYNRGSADDFDEWARLGSRGWGYSDILPYFKRTERRLGPHDPRYRGSSGELAISDSQWKHPLCDAFIEGAINLGLPRNPDYNGESQAGVGYYQSYIDRGWRQSAAAAFLRPIAKRSNLDVRTQAQAARILVEQNKAVGVEYCREGALHAVRARREVIVCAGAANTPKLLQLSGIGPSGLLKRLGLEVVHELQGVGESLQDHYMIHVVLRVKNTETVSGHGISLIKEAGKWLLGRPSVLSISPSLVYGFANSRDLGSPPDMQLDFALGNYSDSPGRRFPVIKLGFYQLRPESRGYVRARSAELSDPPIIQPNYLNSEGDRRVAIDGTRMMRRVLGSPELQPYFGDEVLPGETMVTDDELLDFAQREGLTAYHLCGTCRMGPDDDRTAVVDDRLRVRGLEGLRVVDASIMPNVPSANTSAAVFMIAEKASDMILDRDAVPDRAVAPDSVPSVPLNHQDLAPHEA